MAEVRWCDDPLHYFGENKEVPSLVAALPQICNDPYALEVSQERFLGMYNSFRAVHMCTVFLLITAPL